MRYLLCSILHNFNVIDYYGLSGGFKSSKDKLQVKVEGFQSDGKGASVAKVS